MKYYCVIAADGIYRAYVRAQIMQSVDGMLTETILGYKLAEGERLIDAKPPAMRQHAGTSGFIKPKWDEDTEAWKEAATAEEIADWEAEHPAPEDPEPPIGGNLEQRVTTLEENSATKADVQAVWDEMAAAYTEGVNSI